MKVRSPRSDMPRSNRTSALLVAAWAAASMGCSERTAASAPAPAASSPATATATAPATAPAATAPATAPAPATAAVPSGPRIHSKARFAWINPSPGPSRGWLGYLHLGGSVALRGGSADAARTRGPGCDAWYAVEPVGYVCAGDAATLDAEDPTVVALRRDMPRIDSPWPYEYAESLGAPRYPAIPDEAAQRSKEWYLDEHLAKVAKAREAADEAAIREIDKHL